MRIALGFLLLILAGCRDSVESVNNVYQQGRGLLRTERYDLALKKAEEGLSRAERTSNSSLEWRFRLLKAEVLLARRDAREAAAVLRADPPLGAEWTEFDGKVLLLRARAAYLLSNYTVAEELINQAAEWSRKAKSTSLSAEVELWRGVLLVRRARFQEAQASFQTVLDAANRLHDPSLEANAAGNRGFALLTESRYDEAIPWFERARKVSLSIGATATAARSSGNLGVCYWRLGDFGTAHAQFAIAQAESMRRGNQYELQAWTGNDGNVLYEMGDYSAAARSYQLALDIARQIPNDDWASRWLTDLANSAIQLRDWDTAERYNSQALALKQQIGNKLFEASSLLNAGKIALGRGQLGGAEPLFRSAMAGPSEDPSVVLEAHTGLADLYVRSHRSARADAEFRATVSTIERLDSHIVKDDYKFAYLASLIRFYRNYVDFLMANHPERALEVAESSRSHVLAQRNLRTTAAQAQTPEAYQKLARRAKAVLLEYWLGENQSYLWVIAAHRIRHYVLPPAKAIRGLVETYRNAVLGERNPLEAAGDTGRKLYNTLLAPAVQDLCTGCRVIIVPDQDLYSLNFESLPAGSEPDRFWIENANAKIAASLDYLVDTSRHRRAQEGKGLLVMGDPAPVLQEYPKLEFAAREIDSIRSAMGSMEAKILREGEARPDAYPSAQPGRFAFIHFSAHAAANTESPLDSTVILSGPPNRCKLFARDVMSVPLTAELVTISACRSAGAKTYAGEGPVGLAWAFLRAGARNVIAGVWDVNDRSTAQLMSSLYAEIARGASPADALRAAKLSLIHGGGSYAKPYYWAPFQLYTGAIN